MKQHIFLKDTWVGVREIPTYVSLGDSPKVANSYALFCPKCAAIWGRLMHEHPAAYCQPVTQYCREHAQTPADGTFTVQSPWEGDPRGVGELASWPVQVLAHDIISLTTFHLNHPEKCHL